MPSFATQLLEIKPDMPDYKVAALIAGAMLETDRVPYMFSIDHNIGAPKFEACPLHYDFTYGKTVGIETMKRYEAREWIIRALLMGYNVTAAASDRKRKFGVAHRAPYGVAHSIKRARSRADFHAKLANGELDDDIPF